MTNEHIGICIYEKGRFELRETDNAIIDLKGDFPPILIAFNTVDDGSEPNCADTRGVLHLLNELADNNPNEERHWYLKKMLDKSWKQYHEQKDENEQLKDALNQRTDQGNKYYKENEQLKQELEDALLDVKIYKNANATFDNVYQENNKLKSRIEYLERKIQRERTSAMKEHEKWEKEIQKENEQLKSDLKSYQNMVKQYINLHIDKIRKRYVNPTKEEVAERTRIIRDLEQLKKELQE